ncbi:MAG: elongation factor G, partial [bacterium]
IDTPGHVDFTIEVERSLRVLDGAVVIFCGVGGVEPQSETVWHQAVKYGIPRIAFVNKLDRIGSNFDFVLDSMREKLKTIPCPITIPYGSEETFSGIIDVIEGKLYIYDKDTLGEKFDTFNIPDSELERYEYYRNNLLELLSEYDEEILAMFLDNKFVPEGKIHNALRRATLEGKLVPVLAGSALKYIGVQKVLDAVVNYLPSPDDLPPRRGFDPKTGANKFREQKSSSPFSALVFKVATDPYVERLSYIRIYSGELKVGKQVLNTRLNRKERIMKIFRMHANKREELQYAPAGEIVGVAGLKESSTGDTICDPEHPIAYEGVGVMEPVIYEAIEPKTQADLDILKLTLKRIMDEDPTFRAKVDDETGQTLIYGMGELHLDVIVRRIREEFGIEVNVGCPGVAYREGIRKSAQGVAEFKKQIADKLAYAYVELEV